MDVLVPDLGDFADVEVIEILVKPGDEVAAEDALLTLETEKAAMDVPSPAAGVVCEVLVDVGSMVSAGDRIAVLESTAGEATADARDADEADDAEAIGTEAAGGPGSDASANGDSSGGADAAGGGDSSDDAARQVTVQEVKVTVPDIGDFTDVEIIDLLVAAGDQVELDQGLVTLETEKAAMDVPSTAAGELLELRVAVGDRVNAGDAVAIVRGRSGSPPAASDAARAAGPESVSAPAAGSARAPAPAMPPRPAPRAQAIDEAGFSRAHASPSVRKLARELGVDLARVQGSGRKGRVTADDVKAWVKSIMLGGGVPAGPALPEVPTVDFARFGSVRTEPLSRIQKISGPRLHASWVNLPHVTQHDEADITETEEARQSLKAGAAERGIRLTPLAFVIRACALTLDEFPAFRSSLAADGESLVIKDYLHVGFAADTPNGLVVPVIRDADKKDIYELAGSLADLSARARDGKLKAADMQGGVFTISSLGGIGGTYFTPIINAPEVAILGVSRNVMKPVYRDGEFVPRLMLPLSLSYDHRVIDGAQAARFITRLSALLGDTDRLVEAIP